MSNFSHYRQVRDGHIYTALLYAVLEYAGASHSDSPGRVDAYCSVLGRLGVNLRPTDEVLSLGLLQLFNSEVGYLFTNQVAELLADRRPEVVIGEAAGLIFTLANSEGAILISPEDTRVANSLHILCKGGSARILYRPSLSDVEHTEEPSRAQGLRLLQEGGLASRPAYKVDDLFELDDDNGPVTGRVTKTFGSSICYEDLSTSECVILPNVSALRFPPILGLLALSASSSAPASSGAGAT
jgi:hypothetical protein